ncbi:hypothetical protein [Shewanella oncorhynchi]|uniref:hypothetical protein n=1 Tax=Shewanella oncorhynchi TaxID=2726434 RepID=UPI002E7BA28E|nr:hypothetical protein [Shewanella oncorhynchi]WVI91393.1 hypothetical protein VR487_11065 [Shewanella oncorhynchi]
MGLPVTVYRYTDAGAPQLTNGTPSEWINILKKVLVEGYGDKAPLGWTLEFENAGAFKVAFRNSLASGGSGGYFQFWSTTGGDAAGTTCNINAAIAMSSLDVFIKPIGLRTLKTSTQGKAWEIIGTSRGFYIIQHRSVAPMTIFTNTQDQQICYFIGDIQSFIANDMATFTIISANSVDGDNASTSYVVTNIANQSVIFSRLYASDNSVNYIQYKYNYIFPIITTGVTSEAETLGVQHILAPIILNTSFNTTNNQSQTLPTARGFAPGLYESSFCGYRDTVWPVDVNINGVVFTLLRGYYTARLWISTGEWYE